jgi:hypothetical protein
LLENNFNLLAALCQSTFVGDAAAAIANTMITLLRQISDEVVEVFIQRIVRTKIAIYG